jgi:hypothetical protein
MKKKLIVLAGFILGLAPVMALAQAQTGGTTKVCAVNVVGGTSGNIQGMLCKVGELLSAVLPILIALGVVYFVWGVISYVVGGDEEAKAKGRSKIIYGIIGLAVILGVWGLVKVVTNTFGIEGARTITIPTAPY